MNDSVGSFSEFCRKMASRMLMARIRLSTELVIPPPSARRYSILSCSSAWPSSVFFMATKSRDNSRGNPALFRVFCGFSGEVQERSSSRRLCSSRLITPTPLSELDSTKTRQMWLICSARLSNAPGWLVISSCEISHSRVSTCNKKTPIHSQSINQSIERSKNQRVNQSINQAINRSKIKQPTHQSINRTIEQSTRVYTNLGIFWHQLFQKLFPQQISPDKIATSLIQRQQETKSICAVATGAVGASPVPSAPSPMTCLSMDRPPAWNTSASPNQLRNVPPNGGQPLNQRLRDSTFHAVQYDSQSQNLPIEWRVFRRPQHAFLLCRGNVALQLLQHNEAEVQRWSLAVLRD